MAAITSSSHLQRKIMPVYLQDLYLSGNLQTNAAPVCVVTTRVSDKERKAGEVFNLFVELNI